MFPPWMTSFGRKRWPFKELLSLDQGVLAKEEDSLQIIPLDFPLRGLAVVYRPVHWVFLWARYPFIDALVGDSQISLRSS